MNPGLKSLHRKVQREFFKHRQSNKCKKMKRKFKKEKRKAVKTFYSKFVDNLKLTEPGKWYKMAKQIGATDQTSGKDIFVEALEGMSNLEAADAIAEHFSAVSNEYSPLDIQQVPCYLPAPPPPQVDEFYVYKRINKLKNTRSTYHIDIPN